MSRYTFLLLAFFLSMNVYAIGLGQNMSGVSINPTLVSTANTGAEDLKEARRRVPAETATKKTSARTAAELGNIKESTLSAQQPPAHNNLNDVTPASSATATISCKTYEGKVFEQGEAGYNDCIRTIKNDRQADKTVP